MPNALITLLVADAGATLIATVSIAVVTTLGIDVNGMFSRKAGIVG